jgi:hypothetical protein
VQLRDSRQYFSLLVFSLSMSKVVSLPNDVTLEPYTAIKFIHLHLHTLAIWQGSGFETH